MILIFLSEKPYLLLYVTLKLFKFLSFCRHNLVYKHKLKYQDRRNDSKTGPAIHF